MKLMDKGDYKVPRRELDENIIIATWNIENLGERHTPRALQYMADIIERFDIVAIQEPPASWFETHAIDVSLDTATWPVAFIGDAPYIRSANDSLDLNGVSSVTEGIAATNAWLEARSGLRLRLMNISSRASLPPALVAWGFKSAMVLFLMLSRLPIDSRNMVMKAAFCSIINRRVSSRPVVWYAK